MELDLNKLPEPVISKKTARFSPIWLVPVVAVLVGAAMLIHAFLSAGPRIVIAFDAATGLEAGKTTVKYKDVTVGTVASIALDKEEFKVLVTVDLAKSAEHLARCGSRFWIVRPRVGASGVSGIDTLFSGAYIGVDIAEDKDKCLSFTGLKSPPSVVFGTPGTSFRLRAEDAGSLDIGSPVYYRRIQVGRLSSYELAEDGSGVMLQVFVNAPHDRLVTPNTRFWNASGIDLSFGSNGFKVNTQSMASLVSGGIAFDTPQAGGDNVIEQGEAFALAKDQASAMAPPAGETRTLQLRFERPVSGLSVGAPVLFIGTEIGQVSSIELDYDPVQKRFPTVVKIAVRQLPIGNAANKLKKHETSSPARALKFLSDLVERGLRAQVRTSNLLTGQAHIAIDFVANAPKASFDATSTPPTMPTLSDNNLQAVQDKVLSIISQIEKLPFESMGAQLDRMLAETGQTVEQLRKETLPNLNRTLQHAEGAFAATQSLLGPDSPLHMTLTQSLQELQRTSRSVRALSEQLSRHPESILLGRPKEPRTSALQDDAGAGNARGETP